MTSIFIFLFGAVIGSFLNVVILRLNTGQSIVFGQSKCFSCAKKLRWHELFPIASFVFLRGKCSDCNAKISWQYPLVETITGLIFLQIFNFQFSIFNEFSFYFLLSTFYFLIVFSSLIIIAVYDYRHQIIPNLFVWIFNGLAFLGLFRLPADEAGIFDMNGLLAGFILFAFFAFLWVISRGKWMGFGDVKLALGNRLASWSVQRHSRHHFGFWIGAIIGVALLYLSKNKYGLKSSIAFGPFMILGATISFLGRKNNRFFVLTEMI